jgi:hypothetical protein
MAGTGESFSKLSSRFDVFTQPRPIADQVAILQTAL